VKVLEVDLINLIGNVILAAGFISYVGTFTMKYRDSLLKEWMKVCIDKKIPYSKDFTVERILGDPVLIRQWGIKGLPADSLSIENGIIVT
jgi:dynein heavy chain